MSTWILTAYGALPDNLPVGIADEWESTLKGERARIKASLDNKIPNETEYKDKLADASSDRYDAFLATVGSFWNVDYIKLKQRLKLYRKYSSWETGIDSAFAVGGNFETQVTAKKGKTEAMRYPIGVVGNKGMDRWRLASLVALALSGDTRIARYITSPDTLSGAIEVALSTPYNRLDLPFVVATVTQHAVLAKYASEAGLNTLRDNIVTALNTNLNIIEGHKVSGSTLVITASWDATYSHVKIIADYTKPP